MSKKKSLEQFLSEAKEKHGDKYDYSKVVWVDSHTPVTIICPVHGEFKQTPKAHSVSGYGCNKCAIELRAKNNRKTTDEFIEKAKKKHGDLYDYSPTVYTTAHDDVVIICKKHGPFKQKAYLHLNGEGCPECNNSHLETEVKLLLEKNKINFIQHYHREELGKMEIDFFLPDKNIGIECQGKQHFGFGGWGNRLDEVFERDKRKNEICSLIGVKLIYYGRNRYFKNINGLYDNYFTNVHDLSLELSK